MKKIILFILLFLIGISKVYAYDTIEKFHFGKKVPDVTVRVINGNKILLNNRIKILKLSSITLQLI